MAIVKGTLMCFMLLAQMRKQTSAVLHINRLETQPESPMESCVSAHQMSNKRYFLLLEFMPGLHGMCVAGNRAGLGHWLLASKSSCQVGNTRTVWQARSQMSWHKSSPLAKY